MIFPELNRSLYALSVDVKNSLEGRSNQQFRIESKKILFVLLDGLGYSLAERISLREKVKSSGGEMEKIHSVFPTITVTVLTTLFTATPPGVHGIMGWRILDRTRGRIQNLLDLRGERVSLKFKSYIPQDGVVMVPHGRPSQVMASMITPSTHPYYSPWDGFTQTYEIAKTRSPSMIFLYVPYVDSVSHHFGPYSQHTLSTAMQVTDLTIQLAKDLRDYTVIVTADHGHVPVEGFTTLDEGILNVVDLPPFGDHRNLMFMSRRDPGEYLERYGLMTLDKSKLIEITGGENVPDYAAVPRDKRLYSYWNDEEERNYLGSHGGLHEEEVEIPLVVFNGR